ncbi:MAG: hypothetical protein ACRC7O_10990 [Fimbriiglobus sp.]
MARICERCGHYAEAIAVVPLVCPDCGGTLKFTLLPPPGVVPPPLPGVATGVTGLHGNNPESTLTEWGQPPQVLSFYVPWQWRAPLLAVAVSAVAIAVSQLILSRP